MPVAESGPANPGDLHLPIGRWDPGTGISYVCRVLAKASLSFSGMTSITSARLYLYAHTASGWHANGSGSNTIYVRRKTADWSESSAGTSTATDEIWGGDGDALVESSIADDGDSGAVNSDASDGSLVYVPITNTVREWFDGAANYGLVLLPPSDNAADAFEAYSRRVSGRVPYIWIEYETNTAPSAPTALNPSGNEVVHTGRTVTYSATRVDPDPGDGISKYEIFIYTDSLGTVLYHATHDPSGLLPSFSRAVTLPDGHDAGGPYYQWRVRTADQAGAWSPWSAYARFRPNSVPSTPPAPTVETDTLLPLITGSFSDPDGNAPSGAKVQVDRPSPAAEMWLSGELPISATPWSVVYGGSVLAWGTKYRARVSVADTFGAFSAWGAWREFTPVQPIGPDNLTPRSTATKQNTITPVLTVGHSAQFRNDEVEVYAANSLSSTRLWQKVWDGADYALTLTKARPYAGTALAWGSTIYWRARIEDSSGVASGWSPLVPVYINAEPTAPTGLAARNAAGSAAVLSGGAYLVTTLTPVLEAEYADPDLVAYGDRPSERIVEVLARNADGSAGAVLHTNTLAAPPYASPMAYQLPAGVMAMDGRYLVRWRFRDDAARQSPWSANAEVRVTAAPTVTLVAPASGATITDQTPVLDWSYAGAGGKPQTSYRVEVLEIVAGGAGMPGAYASIMAATAPLAWWRLGETAGTVAANAGSAGGAGAYAGAFTLGAASVLTGDADPAVDLRTPDGHVSITGPLALPAIGFTLSAWLGADPTTTGASYLVAGSSTRPYLAAYRWGSGLLSIQASWRDATATVRTITTPAGSVPLGTRHYAITHDGTTLRCYANGILIHTDATLAGPVAVAGQLWYLGRFGSAYLVNRLDEAAIWNRVLPLAEIEQIYLAGSGASGVSIHDSGQLAGADTAYLLPGGVLDSGKLYRWLVTVWDSDGLSGELV